jgi:hypothetical protein
MAPKKQAVLKDFAALKIEKRIELSAIGIYQIVFRGEADRTWEPRKGTQIHRVWKMQKLDVRQQRAWKKFRDRVDASRGKSGGVTSPYGEQVGDGDPTDRMPKAYTNKAYDEVMYIFERYLGRRESALLWDLLQDDLKSGTALQLEFVGLLRSGYVNSDDARTSGVTHVQNLLDRLADYFNF